MGTTPLGLKLCRRIAREIGQPIKRAIGTGGYTFEFVTFDHEHGWWSKRDGTWGFYPPADMRRFMHWSSCTWNFPDDPKMQARRRAQAEEHAMAAGLAMAIGGPIAVRAPGMPEYLCGETASLHGLDLICAEDKGHPAHPGENHRRHRCGSETWWSTPDGPTPDRPPSVGYPIREP